MFTQPNKNGALITGSARRLGRAMAIFLATKGYDIAVHYNSSKEHALQLKDIIENLCNQKCILIQANLTKFESLSYVINETFQFMPYCNCLINNASVFYPQTFINTTVETFTQNYNLHVQAPLFLTQYFAQKCSTIGHVINMIDEMVIRNPIKYFTYTLSKKSLSDFTKAAAGVLSPQIKVNAIGPRIISNDFLNNIDYYNMMNNKEVVEVLIKLEQLLDVNNNYTGTINFV
ncbi:pteridine reductase 1 [Ehrlichia ruminantium]|uniref:Possible pteridine reductase 1 n=1 Tax=Ehrlichia ruminantium (strain Welgevonden) TaxID=254945 RepID=A0A0H3M0G6_EHRRW|nr:SDR family NAD(P)-dependent oxidoreductase [Ehrlichia ruminantium]QLK50211.1 SDR family NAD(P)-dependent oxidoreductase [Ehrlichia ruminantium]QLK51136.1 SDR family NAD(P)-dependent oxidoreductase [Ehrlichia ruminantium]QLK52059.1 SDR family NAD(P)-dependent oxidoreductase [Ehrlichia ruminantium]QLK52970.1 SDR family NAD(P)-dependent oxidoreductase [Ehrlichia ruminantium]QLK53891.1 SDR family NAD(P)-dependent oxidoreductase [Ehrlichia ruminantium]